MNELAEQFHTACRARFTAGRRRNNYPEDIRAIALSYAEAASAQGVKFPKVAETLGITATTLRSWQLASMASNVAIVGKCNERKAVVPVNVINDADIDDTLYVVQAVGALRIECRSADAVAKLIRALA